MFSNANLIYLEQIFFNFRRIKWVDANNHPIIYPVEKFDKRILGILFVFDFQLIFSIRVTTNWFFSH